MMQRTPAGKVFVYAVDTGERIERFPVDARELVNAGTHTYADPAAEVASEGGDPDLSANENGDDDVVETTPALTPTSTKHPSGGPLKVTNAADARPAEPVKIPTGSSKGKK